MCELIKKDLKRLAASRAFWVLCGLPAAFLLAGGMISGKMEEKRTAPPAFTMGVVDEDQSRLSGILIHYLENDETFSGYMSLAVGEKKEIEEAFRQGRLDAYLLIPAAFFENLVRIENTPITVKISTRDTTKAILIQSLLESYGNLITAVEVNCTALYDQMEAAGMDPERIAKKNQEISIKLVLTALGRTRLFEYRELSTAEALPYGEYYFYMLEGVLILFAGLLPGLYYLRERNSGLYLREKAAGIPGFLHLLSGLLVFFPLLAAVFFAFQRFFEKAVGLDASFVRYGVLAGFLLFSVTFHLLFSCLLRKERAYVLAAAMLHMTSCILGGAVVPFLFLPEGMRLPGAFMPIRLFVRLMAG